MSRESKFLSLVLRHKPEEIGLQLDKHGWVRVDELLRKLKKANQKAKPRRARSACGKQRQKTVHFVRGWFPD